MKLGDLFDFDKEELFADGTSKLQSSKNDESGKYDFITAADDWKNIRNTLTMLKHLYMLYRLEDLWAKVSM